MRNINKMLGIVLFGFAVIDSESNVIVHEKEHFSRGVMTVFRGALEKTGYDGSRYVVKEVYHGHLSSSDVVVMYYDTTVRSPLPTDAIIFVWPEKVVLPVVGYEAWRGIRQATPAFIEEVKNASMEELVKKLQTDSNMSKSSIVPVLEAELTARGDNEHVRFININWHDFGCLAFVHRELILDGSRWTDIITITLSDTYEVVRYEKSSARRLRIRGSH